MNYSIRHGDITAQHDVDAIVNAWNRNILPWWLLLPQGVSGAIKKKAGYLPFRELAKKPVLQLGEAVATSPGRLPVKAIIHVAGINLFWRASRYSIETSVVNAVKLAEQLGFSVIAMPLIGSGSGSFSKAESEKLICQVLEKLDSPMSVVLVKY